MNEGKDFSVSRTLLCLIHELSLVKYLIHVRHNLEDNTMSTSRTQSSKPNEQKDTSKDEKKGMSGLLRFLLLKEPSGSALAKAQEQNRSKANRRSAGSTSILSLRSWPSVSSSSTSSKKGKPS